MRLSPSFLLLAGAALSVVRSLPMVDLFLHRAGGLRSEWVSKLRSSSPVSGALDPNMDASSLRQLVHAGPIPEPSRAYLINGWRWHTLAVLRDLDRFKRLVQGLSSRSEAMAESPPTLLGRCHSFVCGFSWRALMTIEGEIFFPWLSELLPTKFAKPLINRLYQQHTEIRAMMTRLERLCRESTSKEGLNQILSCLEDMITSARAIQLVQEEVFVPFIAAYVSKSEQERFNNMVISKLGMVNANVHLVSMYDAIRSNPTEMAMFNKQIPFVAQALIPIWRRRLYAPKAKWLEVV